MKKIGFVIAVEIDSLLKKYQNELIKFSYHHFDIYLLKKQQQEWYIIQSSYGQIRAAAATQTLIDLFNVDLIVNYGVVGSLDQSINIFQTCLVSSVVHYEIDTSAIDHIPVGQYSNYSSCNLETDKQILEIACQGFKDLQVVKCASGDKFIADKAFKKHLYKTYNTQICDMESAAIVLVCHLNKKPNLLIKTISDSFLGQPDEYHKSLIAASDQCFVIVDQIIKKI